MQLEAWPQFGKVHRGGWNSRGEICLAFEEPEIAPSKRCRMRFAARVEDAKIWLRVGVDRRDLIEVHGHIVVERAERERMEARGLVH